MCTYVVMHARELVSRNLKADNLTREFPKGCGTVMELVPHAMPQGKRSPEPTLHAVYQSRRCLS